MNWARLSRKNLELAWCGNYEAKRNGNGNTPAYVIAWLGNMSVTASGILNSHKT